MAHRAQPVSNRLCAAQWRARDDRLHRQRLDPSEDNPHAVRAHIDLSPPRSIVLNRRKAELARDEAGERIDRDNAKLLRKMTEILSNHSFEIPAAPPAPVVVSGPAGELHRSLNAPARRKELARIGAANAAILRRITQSRPTYDTQRWQAHAQAHEAYLNNMRERLLPADAAAAASIIPLPRFLKDEGTGGALSERRPAHAYLQGNYSKTFTRTRGAAAAASAATQGYSGSQSARLPSTTSTHSHTHTHHGAAASGSHTHGGSNHVHTIYNPPSERTPHRTGVSKAAGGAARVHQLQPMPPAATAGSGGTKAVSPRSVASSRSGGVGGAAAIGSSRAPPSTQILQTGKSFGMQYVLLAVDEMAEAPNGSSSSSNASGSGSGSARPASQDGPSPASHSSSSSSHALVPGSVHSRPLSDDSGPTAADLSSAHPVVPGIHSLIFRCYDPATSLSQVLQVPWTMLEGMEEVRADPSLLGSSSGATTAAAAGSSSASSAAPSASSRKALVDRLLDSERLYIFDETTQAVNAGRGTLRFKVGAAMPRKLAQQQQPREQEEKQQTPLESSAASSAPSAPTPATHPIAYTDSMGVHYYHDEATGNYLPFPAGAVPAPVQ